MICSVKNSSNKRSQTLVWSILSTAILFTKQPLVDIVASEDGRITQKGFHDQAQCVGWRVCICTVAVLMLEERMGSQDSIAQRHRVSTSSADDEGYQCNILCDHACCCRLLKHEMVNGVEF